MSFHFSMSLFSISLSCDIDGGCLVYVSRRVSSEVNLLFLAVFLVS